MSSFVRTLQKRILKRRGYMRALWRVTSEGQPVRLGKGEGNIIAPDASDTGSRQWPAFT